MRLITTVGAIVGVIVGSFLSLAGVHDIDHHLPVERFAQGGSSLIQRSMRGACEVMWALPMDVPCNPANLAALPDERHFFANVFLSEDTESLARYEEFSDRSKRLDILEEALGNGEMVDSTVSVSFNYLSDHWSLKVVPLHIIHASAMTNPSHPQFSVISLWEQQLALQYGDGFGNHLFWGITSRAVHREFVVDHFSVLDALMSPENYLDNRDQSALYLEPGITFVFDKKWLSRVSASVNSIGLMGGDTEIRELPHFTLGIGVTPSIGALLWDVGLSYSSHFTDEHREHNSLALGTRVNFGLLNVVASFEEDETSFGLFSSLWSLRIGFVFERNQFENILGEIIEEESFLSEFSYVF